MKIVNLYLKHYKRFLLNRITELTYNVNEPTQLIIGSNGCGKSSLIIQFSPLPALRADFMPGGIKKVVVEHQGKEYTLTSEVGKKSVKHSFIVDDEEMNPGGTGAVQTELVKQYFNYDSALHDVLCNNLRFTDMSPIQRREWLTRISDLNLDYALGLFKRVATAARDVQGAKGNVAKRLASETAKLLEDEYLDVLAERAGELGERITAITASTQPNAGDHEELTYRIQTLQRELTSLTDEVMNDRRVWKEYRHEHISSQGDLDKVATIGRAKLDELGKKRGQLIEEHETLLKTVMELEERGVQGSAELKAKQELLQREYDSIPVMPAVAEYADRAIPLLREAKAGLETISEFTAECPATLGLSIGHSELKDLKDGIRSMREESAKVEVGLERLRAQVRSYDEAEETECPSCKFRWKENFEKQLVESNRERIKRGVARKEELAVELKKAEEKLEIHEQEQYWSSSYVGIVRNYSGLQFFWNEVTEQNLEGLEMKAIPRMLLEYIEGLEGLKRRNEITDELDIITTALKRLEDDGETQGRDFLTERCQIIDKELEEISKEERHYQDEQVQLRKIDEWAKVVTRKADKVEELQSKLMATLEQFEKAAYNHAAKLSTNELQSELATINHTLNNAMVQKGIVEDLKANMDQLEAEHQAWKLLVKSLSPNEGLIADVLKEFIVTFTEQINTVVAKIWNYELRVLPCGLDGNDLSYKFPLKVAESAINPPDIKNGSTAQVDVIDFSFQLVLRAFLDIEDAPLFADELGSSFDEQHRVGIARFLKQLLDAKQCSQLFMISHAFAVSNSLGAAEVCVLDSSNIVVPVKYNEHVLLA